MLPNAVAKQKWNLYLLPGLGLSVNYFDSLSFPDYCQVNAIALIQPAGKESLQSYAGRLTQHIEAGVPFVLMGMSFGGVLAQEMAKIRRPEAIILLSTIQHSTDLPWYFQLGHKVRLSKILPYRLVEKYIRLLRTFDSKENQILYDNSTVSANFLIWSLDKILNWRPAGTNVPCYQVHGGRDRLLPCRYKEKMFVIPRAKHLLLPEKHREVSEITSAIFSELLPH